MERPQLKSRCSLIFIGLLFSSLVYSTPALNLGIGVDAMYFDYREFDDNDVLLNKEEGMLPGLAFTATLDWQTWYSEFNYQYNGGTVEYDGQTQTGIPAYSDTEEDIIDVNVIVGRYLGDANRYRSAIYAGLGYYYWDRNILPGYTIYGNPVGGLFETYEWSYAFVGGKYSFLQSPDSGLLLDVRLRYMLDATMEVDFLGYQNRDNVELDLGEEWSIRVGLPYLLAIDQHARFSIEPYLTTWFIGRSPYEEVTSGGIPTGTLVREPRSETINFGVTFKYLYAF